MSRTCNGGAQTERCQDFWLFQCSKHPTHLLRSIHQCDAYKQPKAEDDLGYPAQKHTQQFCVLCLRVLCRKSCRKLVDNSKQSKNVVKVIDEVLKSETFAYQGDYTQFLKLVRVILTGETTDFTFYNIGAISKACWMGKAIGAADIFLLKKQN